jgi:hypothetical protein
VDTWVSVVELTSITSITMVDQRDFMDGAPTEVHLADGITLIAEYTDGQVARLSATDARGKPLETFFMTIYPFLPGARQSRLEKQNCSACVCQADGGCRCVPVPCR